MPSLQGRQIQGAGPSQYPTIILIVISLLCIGSPTTKANLDSSLKIRPRKGPSELFHDTHCTHPSESTYHPTHLLRDGSRGGSGGEHGSGLLKMDGTEAECAEEEVLRGDRPTKDIRLNHSIDLQIHLFCRLRFCDCFCHDIYSPRHSRPWNPNSYTVHGTSHPSIHR